MERVLPQPFKNRVIKESVLVGYVDDIAVLIATARDAELAQQKLNTLIYTVNAWMSKHGLPLIENSTQILILSKEGIQTVLCTFFWVLFTWSHKDKCECKILGCLQEKVVFLETHVGQQTPLEADDPSGSLGNRSKPEAGLVSRLVFMELTAFALNWFVPLGIS